MTVERFPGRELGTIGEAYRAAYKAAGGVCPIESGVMGHLADNECEHGRLAGDPSEPCGCWGPETVAKAVPSTAPVKRRRAA